MNLAKAREYFSAYHEGSLDRGLRQAFEAELETDAQLKAEYRAFERVVTQLDSLKVEAPEPDFDLHDRIMARLDRAQFEEKRVELPPFLNWWRGLLLAGAAAAVILPFVWKGSPSGPTTSSASFTPVALEGIQLMANDQGVIVMSKDGRAHRVTLRTPSGEKITELSTVDGATTPIANKLNEGAEFVTVEMDGKNERVGLAIRGTVGKLILEGEGTLKDFAIALANTYGKAVSVWVEEMDKRVTWKLDPANALTSASAAVDNLGLAVDISGDMIRIKQH